GGEASVGECAQRVGEHAVHSWRDVIARAIARLSNFPHSLTWAAAGLAGDAVVSAFEGWALARDFWWAPWLIVAATATLLPFELYAIIRHPRVGRIVIFTINVAIVAYLARRAKRR